MTPDLAPAPRTAATRHVAAHAIRTRFSRAMSAMYRAEVPQYGTLVELVGQVNAQVLAREPGLLPGGDEERARLDVERHGAIRLGTAQELHTMRRIFAVMGMEPVGYYDLSVAGVPVHSTAFRPVDPAELSANPFRVFTSLLRLEMIADPALREAAAAILARRSIFTPAALALTGRFEAQGGLTEDDAETFVQEVLQTFRWHGRSDVDLATYQRLHAAHRLVADVVCFPGPHINHLTPRTLDIDAAQAAMQACGLAAKDQIEGPPTRRVPILLRQTSFKALQETVRFEGGEGAHTARFGEIEQRGVALTPAGRALYDRLLDQARQAPGADALAQAFTAFPDDLDTLRRQGLAWFEFRLRPGTAVTPALAAQLAQQGLDAAVDAGWVQALPITSEDFLPVSAAGIFQSNLGGGPTRVDAAAAAQPAFEQALGAVVQDPFALYAAQQAASIAALQATLQTALDAGSGTPR